MRAFEKLVCGRSKAAEIANMGASIAGDRRRLGREGAELETAWVGGLASVGNCVWGLSQKWEGGLVFEKLVYGSMERAAEIPKTILLAKKVLGCKIGT